MNRRRFLETSLAVPLLGACKAPGEKSQLRGQTWNYPIEPLSEDELKIVSLLQRNLLENNAYASYRCCPDHWIDIPKLYRDSVLRRIAGIQPMSGPTTIAWLRAPDNYYEDRLAEPIVPGQRRYISKNNFQPFYVDDDGRLTSMEAVHDWRAMGRGEMPMFPVEKVAVCAISNVIENPDAAFSFLEKAMVRTWVTRGPVNDVQSWDLLQFLPEGQWVMCYPQDAQGVYRRSGIRPIITDKLLKGIVPPGRAVVGFKTSEYHASFYVLPYIPLRVTRLANQMLQYKVCYGTVSGTWLRYGTVSGTWLPGSLWRLDPYYPRLWVVKV